MTETAFQKPCPDVNHPSGLRHVVEYADYKDEGKTLGTAAFKVMWGAVPGDPPGL